MNRVALEKIIKAKSLLVAVENDVIEGVSLPVVLKSLSRAERAMLEIRAELEVVDADFRGPGNFHPVRSR